MRHINLLSKFISDAAVQAARGPTGAPFAESYIGDDQIISELAAVLRLGNANPKTARSSSARTRTRTVTS